MRGLRLLLVVGAVLGLAGCGGSDCGKGTHDKAGTCGPDEESDTDADTDADADTDTGDTG